MTDEQALLKAIIDDPDDDLPRLAYADWLEEHARTWPCNFCGGSGLATLHGPDRHDVECGECHKGTAHDGKRARATFIREQMGSPATSVVKSRGLDLVFGLDGGEIYGAKVPEGCEVASWNRGFVESVKVTMPAWMIHGPEVMKHHPVTDVVITDKKARLNLDYGKSGWWAYNPDDDTKAPTQQGFGHQDDLPYVIWKQMLTDEQLEARRLGYGGWLTFPPDQAMSVLSKACIRWAKLSEEERKGIPESSLGDVVGSQ